MRHCHNGGNTGSQRHSRDIGNRCLHRLHQVIVSDVEDLRIKDCTAVVHLPSHDTIHILCPTDTRSVLRLICQQQSRAGKTIRKCTRKDVCRTSRMTRPYEKGLMPSFASSVASEAPTLLPSWISCTSAAISTVPLLILVGMLRACGRQTEPLSTCRRGRQAFS